MKKTIVFFASLIFTLYLSISSSLADFGTCRFNPDTLVFKGTAIEQAHCLLKAPKPFGNGATPQPIPEFLLKNIWKNFQVDTSKFKKYLATLGLDENDVGGNLKQPLVRSRLTDGSTIQADYFVIHDTAYPLYLKSKGFPMNINDASWKYSVAGWSGLVDRVNAIVDRQGKLRIFVDFGTQRSKIGMKIERSSNVPLSRNRFIQIENIQPRLKLKPNSKWGPYGPNPGFTNNQYRSLALLYVAASIRRGRWLLPTFHFNIDYPAPNTHNDPQNFDLNSWAASIKDIVSKAGLAEVDKTKAGLASKNRRASCRTKSFKVTLLRSTGNQVVKLPATGKFFGEGHYVTTLDKFGTERKYPKRMNPQPTGYPHPFQCNENISAHMKRSLKLYKKHDRTMTMAKLYPDRWAVWWTPEEGGSCGQGSIGDAQLRTLTPEREMWFLTMNWASGHKPKRDTRFLVSANNRQVVVVSGYETGPGSDDKLGGITREVHGWLKTNNSSNVKVAYLVDQLMDPGPVSCK